METPFNKIILCRQGSNCCPILEKHENGEFTLKDDYEGSVRLTDDQLSLLKDAITQFKAFKPHDV